MCGKMQIAEVWVFDGAVRHGRAFTLDFDTPCYRRGKSCFDAPFYKKQGYRVL